MSRRLAVALAAGLAAACTLVVEHELSSRLDCAELVFSDGREDGGGVRFDSGVTAVSWHGPSFPLASRNPDSSRGAAAVMVDGGLQLLYGAVDLVFVRDESAASPTAVWTSGAHEGPDGFGCSEVLAATYDGVAGKTSWQLIAGGCQNDTSFDGGVTVGRPESQSPALAWAPAPAGAMGFLLGGSAQSCDEVFPLGCFPPSTAGPAAAAPRTMEGMVGPASETVWAVTSAPDAGAGEVRLYSADFTPLGAGPVVPWAGSIALLDADLAMAARLSGGALQTMTFSLSDASRHDTATLDTGDPGAHEVRIAHFGARGTLVKATWTRGDGQIEVAFLDATAGRPVSLVSAEVLCGSAGASFAAPMTPGTTLLQVGDGLHLRPQ